jgi:prolipoprotein diacylglyceryltransferase
MQPSSANLIQFPSPFSGGVSLGGGVVGYAIAFGIIALLLAIWQFHRRDL